MDYARSQGAATWVRVAEPIAIDLGLPASYARDLLHILKTVACNEDDEFEQAEIAVDLPVRFHLRPLQVEQLIAKLGEIAR